MTSSAVDGHEFTRPNQKSNFDTCLTDGNLESCIEAAWNLKDLAGWKEYIQSKIPDAKTQSVNPEMKAKYAALAAFTGNLEAFTRTIEVAERKPNAMHSTAKEKSSFAA